MVADDRTRRDSVHLNAYVSRWLGRNQSSREVSHEHGDHSVILGMKEARFFRSDTHRTLSISTISESFSSLKDSDLVDPPPPSLVSSLETFVSASDHSLSKKSIRLRILGYHYLLSLIDQKKLNEIREDLPEEFDQLIPQLIEFGVVQCPKKFLEKNSRERFTEDEIRQGEHFCSLIVNAHRTKTRKDFLQRLYSSDLIRHDIHHQADSLRQSLSFQGQMSLLKTYEDQIERELNRHVSSWKSIPLDLRSPSTGSSSSSSSSTTKRTMNTIKTKSTKNSKVTFEWNIQKVFDHRRDDYEYLLQISSMDQFDEQWNEKIIVQLIEQGMDLFDQVTVLSNYNQQCNPIEQANKYRIVQAFKRWSRLNRILFSLL